MSSCDQNETWVTLILRPKSRVCNGSILAQPLQRNLRVSSEGKVMTLWIVKALS